MASKGRGQRGVKGAIASAITIVLLVAGILAWARANEIDSFPAFKAYFKSWSDAIDECGAIEWVTFQCTEKPSSPDPTHGDGSGTSTLPEVTLPGVTPTSPEENISNFKKVLTSIQIVESDNSAPYDRSDWKHWVGTPCNTRQQVLINQGANVVKDESSKCKVVSGLWTDPYSLVEFTEPGEIDIDHVVPLSWANRNGAAAWDKQQKEAFANDFDHLLAVSAKENRSKSDKGPGDYMPPNKDFHCEYSKRWVLTLDKYNLSVPQKDFDALEKGLETCKD